MKPPPMWVRLVDSVVVVALACVVVELGFPWLAAAFVLVMAALIWP